MSNSRDKILSALRQHSVPDAALPELPGAGGITYVDRVAQFESILTSVGGQFIRVADRRQILPQLQNLPAFSDAKKICSLIAEVPSLGCEIDNVADPHDLEDVDFAVLEGKLAVAENAAIWVTDEDLRHRVLYFIAQHIALVVNRSTLVDNMHQAYEKLPLLKRGFGAFVSGPSKTADIEQSLVIGAHGARSLTVFMVND
ncbi:MAG: LUD domain-containing protein [Planctomycetota bacterium]|nr:LUD domain-containing protein [Planctomycetota bacterium]